MYPDTGPVTEGLSAVCAAARPAPARISATNKRTPRKRRYIVVKSNILTTQNISDETGCQCPTLGPNPLPSSAFAVGQNERVCRRPHRFRRRLVLDAEILKAGVSPVSCGSDRSAQTP